MLEKIGGRKFIFGLLLVIMGFYFACVGMVKVDEFFRFAEVVGGIYVIGNVGKAITSKIGETNERA